MWKVVKDWSDEVRVDVDASKELLLEMINMMIDKAREGFSVTLRMEADGSAELEITPWEPYRPTCPYAEVRSCKNNMEETERVDI